jgi:hypothetical protein
MKTGWAKWHQVVLGFMAGAIVALLVSLSTTEGLLGESHAITERALKTAQDWKDLADRFEAVANKCHVLDGGVQPTGGNGGKAGKESGQ